MKKTLGEIADELSIIENKIKRTTVEDSVRDRREKLNKEFNQIVEALLPVSQQSAYKLYKRLRAANAEIWNLEESVRNTALSEWFPDFEERYFEIGKRAESIRKINKFRVLYKGELNKLTNEFIDKKKGHLSDESEGS
ncbi:MAG: hypothetical protein ACYSR0_13115 [Planctomycetota bacterium]|jgi:hypothetical protein